MNPLFLELIVVLIGLSLLMVEAFASHLNKKFLAFAGAAGLGVVLLLTFLPMHLQSAEAASFYSIDSVAIFFKRFMLVMTIITLLMSVDFIPVIERFIPGERPGAGVGEFFILPIFACASLMWLVSAINFIMLFVSLELMSITLYILVSYLRKNALSLEAGTKYLILSALATGFLIYGITWIFGVTGTISISSLGETISTLPLSSLTPLLFGVALVLVALCFKIAAFPFQFWLPDVYQGAPTPITAFLSVASKAAGFVVLLRFIEQLSIVPIIGKKILVAITLLSIMTLLFGNLASLAQTNMKRLLAYSSIAHSGYLLMAVASIGAALAGPAIGFYLVSYLLMSSLAFIVLMIVAEASGGDEIHRFQGLHQRSPFLAGAMVVAVLSLAGLPLSAGFFGKFFVFQVALQKGHYGLVIIGTIAVVAGFYYYLKVIRAMYWQQAAEGAREIIVSTTAKYLITLLIAAIFILGVYPTPILTALK
ncbi:MAG: NADH-quinone oxidoreductase subunit N [Chthoniobacterales bacterium]